MSDYLQGAFRMPADATIRLTVDATATDVDWALSEGDTWESVDAIVAEWNVEMVSAFGSEPDVVISIVQTASAYTGALRVTTTGDTITIDWSHAGDGVALRNFLGEAGNASTESSPHDFAAAHKCGWYAADEGSGAQSGTRQVARMRPVARTPLLGGNTQTQHSTSPGDVDGGPFDLLLRITDGSGAQEGTSGLVTFINEIHDTTGALPRFTVAWDDGGLSRSVRFMEDSIIFKPVKEVVPLTLWDCSLPCEVAG